MTHLPCRDVNPPMPCFLKIKSRDNVSLFRVLHLQSGIYSKYPYSLRTAYVFREWPSSEAVTTFIILTPLSFLKDFTRVSCFFFSAGSSPPIVLVRFDAFALTLGLNTGFARARGAIPAWMFGSADWRWRGELLGNQGHTHHIWKGAEDLCLPTMLCPSALPALTAHQKWDSFHISQKTLYHPNKGMILSSATNWSCCEMLTQLLRFLGILILN